MVSRSTFATEYENPDGTRTVKQSTEPLNVKDPQGRWSPVDPTLETDARTGRVRAERHPLKPSLGADAGDPSLVRVEFEGHEVSLGAERPARGRKARVEGRSAEYVDAIDDADLKYEVTAGSVKETIVLSKPPARSSWRFTLDPGALTPVVTGQGTVELRDGRGTPKVVMPPIVTWDSSGGEDEPPAHTGGTYGLEKSGDEWVLTVSVDETWLRDPARAYPVSVDPTVTFGVAYAESYKSDGYWCTNCGIQVGNALDRGDKYWRSAFRFNYESLYGQRIVGAKLDVTNQRSPLSPDKTWPATMYHASAMDFNGVGGLLATGQVGQVGTLTGASLVSFLQHIADIRHMATFLLVGHEAPGVWTYKNLSATLTVDTGSAPPAPAAVAPEDGAVITNLSPTLQVTPVSDPDGDPVRYCFKVATGADAKSGVVVDSGCLDSPTWTVPQAVLQDGVTYSWQAHATSGVAMAPGPVRKFRIDQRVGDRGPAPVDQLGPLTVNLANGNLMTSQSSPTFNTVAGSAGVSMSYNSQQLEPKGLRASYYPDLSHNGGIGTTQEPVLVRTEPQVNVDWGDTSPFEPALPKDWFAARWEGFFQAPATGAYQFAGVHDDALKVWINNTSVYDQPCCSDVNWGVAGTVNLTAGQRVPIKVELAEQTGWAYLRLFVRTSDGTTVPSQVVPADWLYSSDLPALPRGWTLSADLDGDGSTYTEAKVTDQNVVLTDGTGAKHTYTKKSAGGYTAPSGEEGVLALDPAGRITLVEGAESFVFRADGKLESVSPVHDSRKPAALQNIYDGSPSRLREIKDPVSQRSHRLHYGRPGDDCYTGVTVPPGMDAAPPSQMLCRIAYWDGTDTRLWYSQGRLARIEDPGSENTDYGYDADGLLNRVRDSLANDWLAGTISTNPAQLAADAASGVTYTTANGKPHVDALTTPVPARGKERSRHGYRYGPEPRTTYVDVAGLTPATGFFTKVVYDDAYRLLSTTDATGRTTSQTWNARDLKLTSTDAAGRVSTTVYDALDRPTDNYGPAPASCFTGQVPTAACAATVPHTRTDYDEGLAGLTAAIHDNTTLTGAAKVNQTGLGSADGVVRSDWADTASPAAGVPAGKFSIRLNGLITFPNAGNYNMELHVDDGARMWIDDTLVVDMWGDGGPRPAKGDYNNTVAGSTHRIRIDYFNSGGPGQLHLNWRRAPDGVYEPVPGRYLKPNYGLTTSTAEDESAGVPGQSTTTAYTGNGVDAVFGLTTATGPTGLTTRSTYEAVGVGYLRKTGKSAPNGAATTYEYYGDTETRDNPCTTEVEAINQGGLTRTTRSTAPATGPARVDEQVFDASGRLVAKGTAGEWTCTTYDARDRAVQVRYPATGSAEERVVTTNFAVDGNPLVTSVSDRVGTVTTEVDLLGRVVEYTDVHGVRTETSYDLAGRVLAEKVVPPNPADAPQELKRGHDDAGRPTTVTLGTTTLATATYTAAGELASVAYANGSSLSAVGRDGTGATTSHTWRTGDGASVVSAVTRTRAGTVVDESLAGVDARPTGPNYAYDAVGRLTEAWVAGHHYTYDFTSSAPAACPAGTKADAGLNTNRVRLLDETASGVVETGYCYDAADRLLATTGATPVTDVRYDDHGNTTGYSVGGATTSFSWDSADRNTAVRTTGADPADVHYARDATDRIVRRTTAAGDGQTDLAYGFTGTGDTADLVLAAGDKKLLSRTISLPGGVLHTWTPDAVTASLDHPTVRGDLVLTTGPDGRQVGPLRGYTPFGEPLGAGGAVDPDQVPDNLPGQADHGWLGQHQRLHEHAGSLSVVQMGARPYSPLLGRFLSVDPVEGGSANDYDYVNGDPVNDTDVDGRWPDWGKLWNKTKDFVKKHKVDIALTVAGFIPGLGAAAWAYRAYRIVRAAKAANGLAGGIRATRATTWLAGRMWVGRGATKRAADTGYRLFSKNGLRQYRPPAYKGKKWGYQSNFESRAGTRGKMTNNYHVNNRRWW
ncbi:hypothetical protein EKG83_40080 [Saccharothrix syringae]|uniref:PA14 domain-containing protein n=1 Tax=Saccharothrix syringae TaxID=103733 RepID=A0A5Q0HEL6_SACSY|nr:hypothetical protein EKG83_40080 [Saccharothrix syringae]